MGRTLVGTLSSSLGAERIYGSYSWKGWARLGFRLHPRTPNWDLSLWLSALLSFELALFLGFTVWPAPQHQFLIKRAPLCWQNCRIWFSLVQTRKVSSLKSSLWPGRWNTPNGQAWHVPTETESWCWWLWQMILPKGTNGCWAGKSVSCPGLSSFPGIFIFLPLPAVP